MAGASVLQRSALERGAASDRRRSDSGGDEGRRGGTHRIPLLRRHLAQQGLLHFTSTRFTPGVHLSFR